MFGAFYFGQLIFAAPTGTQAGQPCGGMVFGAVYFGQMPNCADVPVPPIPPVPPIVEEDSGDSKTRDRDDFTEDEEVFEMLVNFVTLN